MRTHKLSLAENGVMLVIASAISGSAFAMDFEVGDGWKGSWTSSVSLGTSWRARDPDSRLISPASGALVGRSGTGFGAVDDGDLNYSKGDRFTTLFKLISEVEIKKGDMGALLRGKAWYDYTLNKEDVNFGNQPNGYNGYSLATNSLGSRRPLSDNNFETLNKFDGIYLLDAYVYNSFDLGGKPLQLRVGNQVVNWGESLFIQGVNQINPIDVPSFRKPGAQLKEVLIPVPIVFASQNLGALGNVDVFYQWKWKKTPIEAGCGNYWAVVGGSISSDPGSCNNAVAAAQISNPLALNAGLYVPVIKGKDAKDSGEFGVAYRFNVAPLDAEVGIYAMRIHSRMPLLSAQIGNFTNVNTAIPVAAVWEYPEDMKVFGISATGNVAGWSVGGELSQTRDFPAQINGPDILIGGFAAAGAVVPGVPIPFGPYGPGAMAAAAGNGYIQGFTRVNKTQFQVNAVKAGTGILNAGQYQFVAETGFQWNNLPDYKDDPNALRYGRGYILGPGSHPLYGGSTCAGSALNNPQNDGCQNDGYVTKFAWGYRLKGELTYFDVLGTGVTAQPNLFWSHDVKGHSVDSQFIEDRKALGMGVRFSYAKKYNAEFSAVRYNRNASWDYLRDRDFYSANVGMNF